MSLIKRCHPIYIIAHSLKAYHKQLNNSKTKQHKAAPFCSHLPPVSMASVQCNKTCEESCQQKNQHSSLGQKVSDLFKGHHHQAETHTHTQCSSQTKVQSQQGHATTQCYQSQTHATNGACHGRTRRQHKNKNLVQKIKDGLSGHSSDSSSESDSDDEKCRNRKASYIYNQSCYIANIVD